jgi:hypothetical protein
MERGGTVERLGNIANEDNVLRYHDWAESAEEHVVTGDTVNYRFAPAFLDTETNAVHLSAYENGELAEVHVFDNLPEELVIRDPFNKQIIGVNDRLQIGFVLKDQFYSEAEVIERILAESK